MGYITYHESDQFLVKLESAEDRAALKAALKATPGTDEGEPTTDANIRSFDADNASNVVAFWAADFDWDSRALKVALDQIAPLAWQQIGIHSGVFQRVGKREKALLADLKTKFDSKMPSIS